MTIREKLTLIRDEAQTALDALEPSVVGARDTNDPVTSALDVDGMWTPPRLKLLADIAAKKYPGGLGEGSEFDFRTLSFRRKRFEWPRAFYSSASVYTLDGKPARPDLTEQQRVKLHEMHNYSFAGAGMLSSGVNLAHLPVAPAADGAFVTAIPSNYTGQNALLWEHVDKLFAQIGVSV